MSRRRFVLVYTGNSYYSRMMRGLAGGLQAEGADAIALPISPLVFMDRSQYAWLKSTLTGLRPTDVLAINAGRDRLPVPPDAVHHCWIQDLHGMDPDSARFEDGFRIPWVWVRSWTAANGDDWLPPATDFTAAEGAGGRPLHDVSFVSFIPPMEKPPDVGPALSPFQVFSRVSDRLLASRVFLSLPAYAELVLQGVEEDLGGKVWPERRQDALRFLQAKCCRYLQRKSVVDTILRAAPSRGWSIGLYGPNWQTYETTRLCAGGEIETGPMLARLYVGSKVSLHLNGDCVLHTRTLEALACGSPVLAEDLGDPAGELEAAGLAGLVETFRGLDQIVPAIERILKDLRHYDQRALEASRIIAERHSWRARARTILAR